MNMRGAWSLILASSILGACMYSLPVIDEIQDCDAVVDACDAGNTSDAEVCDGNCPVATCGDGVITPPEQCDDGNTNDLDTCSATCRNNFCGDERKTDGEECDDGNFDTNDECDPNCRSPRCGNRFIGANEVCDDGNDINDDECNSTCTFKGLSSLFLGKPGQAAVVDGDINTAQLRGGHYMTLWGNTIYLVNDHTVRAIDIGSRTITTIAGVDGQPGYADAMAGKDARFSDLRGVTTDGTTIWVADVGNHVIRAIQIREPYGVTTVAGTQPTTTPITIVDGAAAQAQFDSPRGLTHHNGIVYMVETNAGVLRTFDPNAAMVATVAGTAGALGTGDGFGASARFYSPRHIATTNSNLLYIADSSGYKIRTYNIETTEVKTLAGTGTCGFTDGPAASSTLYAPRGMALDGLNNVYFPDCNAHTIRQLRIDSMTLGTLSGTPEQCTADCSCTTAPVGGYAEGKPSEARWNFPYDLVYHAQTRALYVSDGDNHVIRVIQ